MLTELEADTCKVTEALKAPKEALQEEKKVVDALKQELLQSQPTDDPMGISSLDELERKELNILRELAVSLRSQPLRGAVGNRFQETVKFSAASHEFV